MAVWNPPITSSIGYAYETTNVNLTGNTYVDGLLWRGGWTNNGINSEINASVSDPVILSYSTLTASAAHYVYGIQPDLQWGGYGPYYQNWTSAEISQIADVINNVEAVANVSFTYVGNNNIGDINFVGFRQFLPNHQPSGLLGKADVPGSAYNLSDHNGVYINHAYDLDIDFAKGSMNYQTLQHELAHAMGLAHPHDEGGGSNKFPGVTGGPFGDLGDYGQNSGTYTTMSYNNGWGGFLSGSKDIGAEASFMAFDIAALQSKYGANTNYNTGDNTYYLPASNTVGSAFYECIWDAGGTDTISNASSAADCYIDLRAATLDYSDGEGAGGYLSKYNDIFGGFTIANGVVIENAEGGSGSDFIFGNDAANYLNGGSGDNDIRGYAGNDTMVGGANSDSFTGGAGNDTIDGGAGADSAVYQYTNLSDILISKNKGGGHTTTSMDGTDVLTNIEFLSAGGESETITTLYDAQVAPTFNYLKNDVSTSATMSKYDGVVNWLDFYFYGANDRQTVSGTDYSEFFNLLGDTDAVDGRGGDDVLDGGTGSNFMTGGTGKDTFFIDGRGLTNTWSTITDLTTNDTVTLWGWQNGTSQLIETQENQGASGFKGITYFYDLDGNGLQETKLTFTGLTESELNDPSVNTGAAVPHLSFSLATTSGLQLTVI